MTNAPSKTKNEQLIDLAVKSSQWPPAHWLHTKAKLGDRIGVRIGGDFFYPDALHEEREHDILLIAGGVGINPLASILFHVTEQMGK